MRIIAGLAAILLLGWAVAGCLEPQQYDVEGEGMIRFVPLEGGFYGIITETGKYDPVNLPDEFRQDSLRVYFKGNLVKERVSFHMWGNLLELKEIRRLERKPRK
ncbi:MAG TPA: hypothetical protein ENJ23_02005 [Bacteroidetes bacterium]|nr:hypothetical protein [Bacteroidota bacterium]